MIFVTVGNARTPFLAWFEAADQAAARLDEEMVIQSGHTPYCAEHAQQVAFLDLDAFARAMRRARIIVAHAGCGSTMTAIQMGKPIIVMPRRKRFGEHVNGINSKLPRPSAPRPAEGGPYGRGTVGIAEFAAFAPASERKSPVALVGHHPAMDGHLARQPAIGDRRELKRLSPSLACGGEESTRRAGPLSEHLPLLMNMCPPPPVVRLHQLGRSAGVRLPAGGLIAVPGRW